MGEEEYNEENEPEIGNTEPLEGATEPLEGDTECESEAQFNMESMVHIVRGFCSLCNMLP